MSYEGERDRSLIDRKLVSRGVTLTGAVSAALRLLIAGREPADLQELEQKVREWNRDARAVAEEDKP